MKELKVVVPLDAPPIYQVIGRASAEKVVKHSELLTRLKDGSLKIPVIHQAIHHVKLYLLEEKERQHVIPGGISLSEHLQNYLPCNWSLVAFNDLGSLEAL